MAQDTNIITIIGRLVREVELAYTPSNNTPIAKFSIANNGYGKDSPVNFFDIVVWNKMAEICQQYLKKGSQVCITGSLKQDRFQDKDGNKRSKMSIVANNVQFIGSKGSTDGSGGTGGQQNSQSNSQPSQNSDPFDNADFRNSDNEVIPF